MNRATTDINERLRVVATLITVGKRREKTLTVKDTSESHKFFYYLSGLNKGNQSVCKSDLN